MYFAVHRNTLCGSHLRREFLANGTLASTERREAEALRRRRALKMVDTELSKGNFKAALSLVKQLQGKPGGLRGFGAAKQVPQRITSLDELKLCGIDKVLVNSILDSIERSIQFALLDEVSFKGLESLIHDESNESLCEDHLMCMQHEAGHFLVAYLLGVLPKGYTIPSMEALRKDKFAGGRVKFVGFEFLREVNTTKILKKNFNKRKLCDKANEGKISSKTLNRFSCVILGGLAAEHLVCGYSEGLHSDVDKLNRVLKWLGFAESEVDTHVKWAVVNTVLILRRHHEARSRLAEAMALGRSVGFCIDTIENAINEKEI